MAKKVPAEIQERFDVSPDMPEKFNFGTLDYVAADLHMEQAEKLAANPNFSYITAKKEKVEKPKKAKGNAE